MKHTSITIDTIETALEGASVVVTRSIGDRMFCVAFDNGTVIDVNLKWGLLLDSVIIRKVSLVDDNLNPSEDMTRDVMVDVPVYCSLYHRLRLAFAQSIIADVKAGIMAHREMCERYQRMHNRQMMLSQRPALKDLFGMGE